MVLGRERAVLVLDDTEGVWPRHRDNLVQIERYLYFPADAARFGYRCVGVWWWWWGGVKEGPYDDVVVGGRVVAEVPCRGA